MEKLEVEIIYFDGKDVICASNGGYIGGGGDHPVTEIEPNEDF